MSSEAVRFEPDTPEKTDLRSPQIVLVNAVPKNGMVGTIAFVPPCLGDTKASEVPILSIFIGALAPTPASLSGRAKKPACALALTNGWVLHFTQDDNRSIRLAASPSGLGAAPISIVFSEFDNDIPLDLVKTYDLPVKDDLRLDTILDVLENGHFKQYMFDASGHGCRYWIWSLLGFLKENGIITGGLRVDGARVCLQQVWTKGGQLAEEEQQTHLVPGNFVEIE